MSEETTSNIKKAEIGYFDGEIKTIGFNDGDSVRTLLTKSGLDFGEGQTMSDDEGENVELSDKAEEGKTYWIVGNYKQG